jgi:hypothetical protein
MAASLRLVLVPFFAQPWSRYLLVAIDYLIIFTGDIVYVELPGVPMVVLNSYEVTQELLGKRTKSTGGRKIGYMIREV